MSAIDPRETNPPRPIAVAMIMIGLNEAAEKAKETFLNWCKGAGEQFPFLAPQQLSEQEVLELEELFRTGTPLSESAIETYCAELRTGQS